MTEHTPGPWTTEPTTDHAAAVRVMDEQEVTVALCYQQPGDTWTAEANAALIAAAPELLAALAALVTYDTADAEPPAPDTREYEILKAARLAIAKAEGR